jgi:5-methylcytosine-specific restriction endonuclease McrA
MTEPMTGQLCVYCAAKAETVEYIVPLDKGGRDDPTNTVAVCLKCEQWQGSE